MTEQIARLPYRELNHKEHMRVHPSVFLCMFDLPKAWTKVAEYKWMMNTDEYTLTATYSVIDNMVTFEKQYSDQVKNTVDKLCEAS